MWVRPRFHVQIHLFYLVAALLAAYSPIYLLRAPTLAACSRPGAENTGEHPSRSALIPACTGSLHEHIIFRLGTMRMMTAIQLSVEGAKKNFPALPNFIDPCYHASSSHPKQCARSCQTVSHRQHIQSIFTRHRFKGNIVVSSPDGHGLHSHSQKLHSKNVCTDDQCFYQTALNISRICTIHVFPSFTNTT